MNLYQYVSNDPINGVDPTGLQQKEDKEKEKAEGLDDESSDSQREADNLEEEVESGLINKFFRWLTRKKEKDKEKKQKGDNGSQGNAVESEVKDDNLDDTEDEDEVYVRSLNRRYARAAANAPGYVIGEIGPEVTIASSTLMGSGMLAGMGLSEAKRMLRLWDKGTFKKLADSIRYHIDKHGGSLGGAKYLRKASRFNKKGSKKVQLSDSRTRWTRPNGEFLIEKNGKIVSYGPSK